MGYTKKGIPLLRPDFVWPALFISMNQILGQVLVCFLRIKYQPTGMYVLVLLDSVMLVLCFNRTKAHHTVNLYTSVQGFSVCKAGWMARHLTADLYNL